MFILQIKRLNDCIFVSDIWGLMVVKAEEINKCDIWGFYSDILKDSSFLVCKALLGGNFLLAFQQIINVSLSGSTRTIWIFKI